jgi:hypothetical protein
MLRKLENLENSLTFSINITNLEDAFINFSKVSEQDKDDVFNINDLIHDNDF